MLLLGGTKQQQQIFGRVNLCTYWANRWSSNVKGFCKKRWHLKFSGLLDDIASSSYHYFPKKKTKGKKHDRITAFYPCPVVFYGSSSFLDLDGPCKGFALELDAQIDLFILPYMNLTSQSASSKSSFVFCPAMYAPKLPAKTGAKFIPCLLQNLDQWQALGGKNRLWHWHRWKHHMRKNHSDGGAVGQLATCNNDMGFS